MTEWQLGGACGPLLDGDERLLRRYSVEKLENALIAISCQA